MKIENILEKYHLSEEDLNVITTCMMEEHSLVKTSKMLKSKVTPEQVFAIAKFYCLEEFSLPIDEMAPHMALERMEMQFEKHEEIAKQIEYNKEVKRLKAIEEDLKLLEAEMKQKLFA